MPFLVKAQLCNGSLGDPAVNITFGTGAAFPQNIAPGYQFVTNDCPSDGSYTIRSSTQGCFGSSWHSLLSDHTGNLQGNFMLINASHQPGDFYLDTVKNLCAKTTYEFAAWIANVLKPIPNRIRPNITFTIEEVNGTVLQTFSTGDIVENSTPVWKQYGFYFTTPPGVFSVVLRMRNNAPGGSGNDLALDDITFRPCGPQVGISISGNRDTVHVCEGDRTTFTLNGNPASGYTSPVYQWQVSTDGGVNWTDIAGANELSYLRSPTGQGNYLYRLTTAERENFSTRACRIASRIVSINIHPPPPAHAGPDKVILKGEFTGIGASGQNGNRYSWTPVQFLDNPAQPNPKASPDKDMIYRLEVVSVYGCRNADEVSIKVVKDIYIPNAFTPNGDGQNDFWRIPFIDPSREADVKVFNRYGNVVYQSSNSTVSWNGKKNGAEQPTGAYVYVIKFKNRPVILKGQLMLIR